MVPALICSMLDFYEMNACGTDRVCLSVCINFCLGHPKLVLVNSYD
jgi:hypothetical protein